MDRVSAATPDKLPLIGPVVEHPRLYLATGHEGLGITTSLGTAKLLVDQIVNRAPAIPVEPYLPARVAMIGAELAHAETVRLIVNDVEVTMPAGSMVSAAIMATGVSVFRPLIRDR